jgi:hypothetical protein
MTNVELVWTEPDAVELNHQLFTRQWNLVAQLLRFKNYFDHIPSWIVVRFGSSHSHRSGIPRMSCSFRCSYLSQSFCIGAPAHLR